MAPKKATARPGSSSTAKRPIRGPSQRLRSPVSSPPMGRVQSLVASMAGDPAALSRFAEQMDGFLQQCSSQPSTSAGMPHPVGASSPASSLSSENGGEGLLTGTVGSDPQLTRPRNVPATRGRTRRSTYASRGASGRGNLSSSSARRGRIAQPPAVVASGSGLSRVVSSPPASGLAQPNPDSESSVEDSLPVPASRSSGGKRHSKGSSRRHAGRRRDDTSSSYSAPLVAQDPGASQPNSDSASSMEDSLPVPAKRSLGGKRHRRRSSRKHAKRRRADSSSSYTGTSSSSDDEADQSMELYWGFGETASGLPRWAWERRANTHRAKYGAVQECRDGVLVPDTKVSTNSARDIIPGSHLATKLRSRILNGRYVDIFKLAPPSEDQEKGPSSKKRPGAAIGDRTFEHWLDCFQVFAGVVVAAYPRRSLHLFVYLSIVRSAFTKAGEKAAIKYDENFRRRAAKIPTARWDRRDLDVWTTHVAPLIDKKAPEQQKFKPAAFRTSRRLLCWDFNKGSCQRQGCRFAHVCERCNGSHAASSCFGGRRPFRGGRGGSQQTQKPTPSPATSAAGK
ncbi:uncharacterized protein LOC144328100 [Podarcis muralis]